MRVVYRDVVINAKREATKNRMDTLALYPGESLLAGKLLERIRQARGLPANATEQAVLTLLRIVDKRSPQPGPERVP